MIRVIPMDFLGQGALLEPADSKLHDAAIEFANRELAEGKNLNLARFSKVWVGLDGDEVKGLCGYVLRPDVPLLRATDADVLRAMCKRMNDYFSDNQARGSQVFIYIGNEKPEQRCPEWRQVLKEFGAVSGQRFLVEVR